MPFNLSSYLPIPQQWKDDLDKKLSTPSINSNYPEWKAENSFGKEIDAFAISFTPSMIGKITVFNDETDKDEQGNYEKEPYLIIGENKALIGYNILTALKASTGFNFKSLDFNFDTSQNLSLSYYGVHDNAITLKEAFKKNLCDFKFIFSHKDIESLLPNEGLAIQYQGSIKAGLKISASDAYSGTISALSQLLPSGVGINGKYDAGASVSFSIEIKDEFKSFIQKLTDDTYLVKINKAVKGSKDLSAGIKISAQITKDEAFSGFCNSVLDALLGGEAQKINDIIANKLDKLSDADKDTLSKVFSRLGWEVNLTDKQIIQPLYEDLKTKAIEKVTEVLTQKVELGFSFEYQQINTQNTLFEAVCPTGAIKNGLREIIMFKAAEFADIEGVEIKTFLFEKTTERTNKLGFALQFGNFKALWQNTNSYKEQTVLDYVDNKTKISFSPQRTHESKFLNHKKWYFCLNAEMNEPQRSPRMNDFDFGLTLHWEDTEKKTKLDELYQFVDMAIIWNCIPEDDLEKVVDELSKIVLDKEDVKFECHYNIPLGTLEKLFDSMASPDLLTITNSLSEAVPYQNYPYRKSPSTRKIAYNPIWQFYLKNKPLGFKTMGGVCGNHINNMDSKLAKWEAQFETNSTTMDNGYLSFVGLIEFNYVYQVLNSIRSGAKIYDTLIDKNKPYSFKELIKGFKKIDDTLHTNGTNKLFNLNFLARYLTNMTSELNLTEEIESFAKVQYSKTESKTITYSKSY